MASRRSKKASEAVKTRCNGTMTESQYLAWVRSALRSKWLRWPPRALALKEAQRPYKGENKRQKFAYECAICHNLFSQKDVEVDHYPHDAGSILSVDDIGQFCNNLYCETDNLRVVCKDCHAIHTLAQKDGSSFEEARLKKQILEFLKQPKKTVVDFCQKHGYTVETLSNEAKRRAAVEAIFKGGSDDVCTS